MTKVKGIVRLTYWQLLLLIPPGAKQRWRAGLHEAGRLVPGAGHAAQGQESALRREDWEPGVRSQGASHILTAMGSAVAIYLNIYIKNLQKTTPNISWCNSKIKACVMFSTFHWPNCTTSTLISTLACTNFVANSCIVTLLKKIKHEVHTRNHMMRIDCFKVIESQ